MSLFTHQKLCYVFEHDIKTLLGAFILLSAVTFADTRLPTEAQPHHGRTKSAVDPKDRPFAVFGYLPEYRLGGFDYEAAFQTGLTHLIYFSLEIDGTEMVPSTLDRLPTKDQAEQARAAADKVGGKIMIGFGGNGRSHGFAQVVATTQTRLKFLQSLNKLLLDYNFDGVDYNWEYPRNKDEWLMWGMLMSESKKYLLGGKNVVTFTMYQDPNHAQVIRDASLLDTADYVHCMSYDYVPGKHSTYRFAEEGVRMALTQMAPKHSNLSVVLAVAKKFTLGLPFYGRDVKTGIPQTYADISKMTDFINVNQIGDMYFNSMSLIRKKTKLAKLKGLGGVMVWELGQDIQPLSSPKSLMWGIMEAVTGNTQKKILEERRAEKEKNVAIQELSVANETDL